MIARTPFWVLWFFGAGLGFGDVRLAALVGLVTARLGWQSFVVGIYGAQVLAVLYVLARAVVTRRSPRGQGIPWPVPGCRRMGGPAGGGRLVIASSSDPTVVDRLRRDVDALCVTPRHREVPGSLEAARAYCRERLEEVGWSVGERSFRPRPALRYSDAGHPTSPLAMRWLSGLMGGPPCGAEPARAVGATARARLTAALRGSLVHHPCVGSSRWAAGTSLVPTGPSPRALDLRGPA